MSAPKAIVWVEGKSDKRLVDCLLADLGLNDTVTTKSIGGGLSSLQNASQRIRQDINSESKTAVILDADDNPAEKRAQLTRELKSLELHVDGSFLIPNDEKAGRLETLLENLVAAEHRVILDCFEQYKACLKENSAEYHPPCEKAKIYAYCEAVGTKPKPHERDYQEKAYWDLKTPEIKKLKDFLTKLAH